MALKRLDTDSGVRPVCSRAAISGHLSFSLTFKSKIMSFSSLEKCLTVVILCAIGAKKRVERNIPEFLRNLNHEYNILQKPYQNINLILELASACIAVRIVVTMNKLFRFGGRHEK